MAIVTCTALLRMRLLDVPLERDEGEYAYMGQLILRGEVPYLAAHNMKLPGVYYANAAIIGLLGDSDVAIRLALVALNAATVVLLYLLARRLFDVTAALTAAAAYGVLSVGSGLLGFTANAEHFVVLPMVGGVLCLAPLDETPSVRRLVAGGLLLGLAYVMKQHGAAFVAFGGLWVLIAGRRRDTSWPIILREAVVYTAGALTPFVVTCLAMLAQGAFQPFWFWTVSYAREYATMIPLGDGLGILRTNFAHVAAPAALLWALAALGVTALAWDDVARRRAAFLGLFTLCSFGAVCTGLRFSEHYFILLVPAAALLAGGAASACARASGSPAIGAGVATIAVVASLVADRRVLFELSPVEVSRATYGTNPFPEAIEIARWLREHTAPDERIAVVGSEPEIYFYAQRPAATSYIYTYPLMEAQPFAHWMQEDMIAQLDRARPKYLVLVSVDTSWTRRADSSTALFEWAERTVKADYTPVGRVDVFRDRPSAFHWGDATAGPPASRAFVSVFERRS
jgi:hypothetical protein